jgi:hypothetical protein
MRTLLKSAFVPPSALSAHMSAVKGVRNEHSAQVPLEIGDTSHLIAHGLPLLPQEASRVAKRRFIGFLRAVLNSKPHLALCLKKSPWARWYCPKGRGLCHSRPMAYLILQTLSESWVPLATVSSLPLPRHRPPLHAPQVATTAQRPQRAP